MPAGSRPPKSWFESMKKEVKEGNPDYDEDTVNATVGKIWYGLDSKKQNEITKRKEGKLRVEAQTSDKFLNVIHKPCGKRSVVDLGSGLRCLYCGVRIEDMSELEQIKTSQTNPFMFPNLFSSEAKKWLEIQVKLNAVQILGGIVSTPEQAIKAVDQSIDDISKQLASAVEPEVKRIMENQKEKILDEIVVSTEQNVQQPAPPIPPAAPPAPAPAAQPAPQPQPVTEPVEASASTYMPAKLRAAFESTSRAKPEVKFGEWIVCGLEDGSNEGLPKEFIEKEELDKILETAKGLTSKNAPLDFIENSVIGDYTGLTKISSISVKAGYGARICAGNDKSPWIVFDKKDDADEFAKELEYSEEV